MRNSTGERHWIRQDATWDVGLLKRGASRPLPPERTEQAPTLPIQAKLSQWQQHSQERTTPQKAG